RVGFDNVRSMTGSPPARRAASVIVKRFGAICAGVRSENNVVLGVSFLDLGSWFLVRAWSLGSWSVLGPSRPFVRTKDQDQGPGPRTGPRTKDPGPSTDQEPSTRN